MTLTYEDAVVTFRNAVLAKFPPDFLSQASNCSRRHISEARTMAEAMEAHMRADQPSEVLTTLPAIMTDHLLAHPRMAALFQAAKDQRCRNQDSAEQIEFKKPQARRKQSIGQAVGEHRRHQQA